MYTADLDHPPSSPSMHFTETNQHLLVPGPLCAEPLYFSACSVQSWVFHVFVLGMVNMSETFVSLIVLYSKRSALTRRKGGSVCACLFFFWYELYTTNLFF